jgi:ABC-2 type transport system ATP-binding protein
MIEVEGLTKRFGQFTAVDSVSFQVEKGEIFGFLGPNGAGKTTTMMMLTTALNPTSGSATVCGYDITRQKDMVRGNTGIVFEEMSLDINLTARENLDFHARMYHLPEEVRNKRVAQVLQLVGLEAKQDMPVKHYSGGMQRRLEIARGMLNYPRILFLDEPTLGLDVQTRRLLWDYVRRLNTETDATVMLNTHYVEEAEYLCDRVAILNRGRILITDSPQGLKSSIGGNMLSVRLADSSATGLIASLKEKDWVEKLQERNGWLEISIAGEGNHIDEMIKLAREKGMAVASISQHKPSLEDAFLYHCRKPSGSSQDD